jgi:hypothetical protein
VIGKTPYSTVGFNWMLTDYVIEDASYYALRELIVGYTLLKTGKSDPPEFNAGLLLCPQFVFPCCSQLQGH